MKTLENKIPLDIRLIAFGYPIINYKKEYGEDCGTENLAKGEIEKFNFVKSNKHDFVGQRVCRLIWDENRNEYDTIWVHLGRDYFKQISKVLDNRTC